MDVSEGLREHTEWPDGLPCAPVLKSCEQRDASFKAGGIAPPEEPLLPNGDSKAETDFLGRRFSVSLLPCTGSLPGPWVLLCRLGRKHSSAPAWGSAPWTSGPSSILVGPAGCLYLPQQLQSAGGDEGVGGWRTWIQLSCTSPAKAKTLRAGVEQVVKELS